MSLTHSLTQSQDFEKLNHNAQHGFGFGNIDPIFVPSALSIQKILDERLELFRRDYDAKIGSKAAEIVDVSDRVAAIQHSRRRTPYWFVTINPKLDTGVEVFHNSIVEFFSVHPVENLKWSYELSSNGNLHCHMLFEFHTTDKNWCDRKLKNHFLALCGNKKHIHVRWVSKADVSKVQSYLVKTTVAKSKKGGVDKTKLFRESHGLPDLLTEDHLLVWSDVTNANDVHLPLIPLC